MRKLLVAFAVLCGGSDAARGELILDDFDVAATVVSPAMRNQFVDTLGVGSLGARRSIRIAALSAQPEGRIDVNPGGSSAFVASLGALNPTDAVLSKIVAVQSN